MQVEKDKILKISANNNSDEEDKDEETNEHQMLTARSAEPILSGGMNEEIDQREEVKIIQQEDTEGTPILRTESSMTRKNSGLLKKARTETLISPI